MNKNASTIHKSSFGAGRKIQDLEFLEGKLQKRNMWLLTSIWLITVIISLFWNVNRVWEDTLEATRNQARSSFDKDIIYRRWNAEHKGVYAPVTDTSPPNPYLTSQERDIITPSGIKLTLINPAYMTRQALERQEKESGIQGHITSLKPIRPENKADPWETTALHKFAKGRKEVSSLETINDTSYMRLMRPLMVTEVCMKCHAIQGYQVGDVRGGISVSVPMETFKINTHHHWKVLAFWHAVLLTFGLTGLLFNNKQILQNIEKRKETEQELELAYEELEQRVEDRTKELKLEIEERQKAQLTAISSKNEWERTFNSVSDLITIINEKHEIIRANKAVSDKLGVPVEQLIHSKCFCHFHGTDVPIANCPHEKLLEDHQQHSTIIFDEQTGSYLNVVVTPLYEKDGTFIGSVHVARDITALKEAEKNKAHAEAKLRKMEKMEAIGMMAGGVAHDLNNILAGIIGYPELLLRQLDSDSKIRQPLEAIYDSGKRASIVVADLLTVARGVVAIQENSNLNTLVNEYLDSPEFKKIIEELPGVTVSSSLDTAPLDIFCSTVHIKKCIMNLVANAIEAIGDNGSVVVSTFKKGIDDRNVKWTLAPGEYVVLSVKDNGPGIAQEDLEHIFEPFYTKKVMGKSGTGLGLAIIWNTMKDHEGKVFVESSDKGTCFYLYFPVSDKKSVYQSKNDTTAKLTGNNEHILVVDDEPQLRDLASQMLQTLGYHVDSVSSGELAVELVKENPMDLIILDMLMEPGMNGRQTYEEIIKLYPDQKALIATGFSTSNDVGATLKLGARGFIKKPYSIAKLGQAVEEALNS